MNLLQALQLLTHLGPRWVAFRARYAWRRKTGGLVRRSPPAEWSPTFAAPPPRPRLFAGPVGVGPECLIEAGEIAAGRFRLFSFHRVEAGFPPRWHKNQLTGTELPAAGHWSTFSDGGPGDIKGVWELSRFPWAFPLARAYSLTGDNRHAEAFWTLFEDWLRHDLPNCGPNWMCGQEATFRLMAATFARHVCAPAPATTMVRVGRYDEFVRMTGRRIAANLDYALSQSNNHGISEAVGLVTAALLVPEEPGSETWRREGLRALAAQLDALVYRDGAFAQHSANYHRVLIHDILWMVAVLRQSGAEAPGWLLGAGRRSLTFLDTVMNPETGRVPVYGADDGANVLPLGDAGYRDLRPVVQAGYALLDGRRRLPPGSHDELAAWLTGPGGGNAGTTEGMPVAAFPAEPRVHFPDGGCLLWRSGETRLFLRCPTRFRHRPSQADLLHADIEWRGQPIAIDPGTFSYNTTGVFAGAFAEAAVHNSITFGGAEPMEKAGRFLYLPWPAGAAAWDGTGQEFSATHDGWDRRHARHSRRVRSPEPHVFLIEDRLVGRRQGTARLHWLLADYEHELDVAHGRLLLHTPAGVFVAAWQVPGARVTLVRADPASARGWWSPHYGQVAPALSLAIEWEFTGDAGVTTRLGPLA